MCPKQTLSTARCAYRFFALGSARRDAALMSSQRSRSTLASVRCVAKTYQKYTRYSSEYKQDALDELSDQIETLKPIYQNFKCAKSKKSEGIELSAR
jgi:hypothetical protein